MNSPAKQMDSFAQMQESNSQLANPVDSMKFEVIEPISICDEVLEGWNHLRSSDSVFSSPYFDAEFTKAVAKIRGDVRIAIARDDRGIVAVLPFQENSPGKAVPVGGLLNDWHGIMGCRAPGVMEQMLRAAKLESFKFHAIDNADRALSKYIFREFNSHYLDLSEGWEQYRKWVFKNSSTVKRQGQKTRALEREVGKIRFEFESDNPLMLERLIELKRARYQNSNTFDILGVPWASQLLRELHRVREPNFRGILSILWAGDQFVEWSVQRAVGRRRPCGGTLRNGRTWTIALLVSRLRPKVSQVLTRNGDADAFGNACLRRRSYKVGSWLRRRFLQVQVRQRTAASCVRNGEFQLVLTQLGTTKVPHANQVEADPNEADGQKRGSESVPRIRGLEFPLASCRPFCGADSCLIRACSEVTTETSKFQRFLSALKPWNLPFQI